MVADDARPYGRQGLLSRVSRNSGKIVHCSPRYVVCCFRWVSEPHANGRMIRLVTLPDWFPGHSGTSVPPIPGSLRWCSVAIHLLPSRLVESPHLRRRLSDSPTPGNSPEEESGWIPDVLTAFPVGHCPGDGDGRPRGTGGTGDGRYGVRGESDGREEVLRDRRGRGHRAGRGERRLRARPVHRDHGAVRLGQVDPDAGLDTIDSGDVWIGGTKVNGLRDKGLTDLRRSRVGFVFQ